MGRALLLGLVVLAVTACGGADPDPVSLAGQTVPGPGASNPGPGGGAATPGDADSPAPGDADSPAPGDAGSPAPADAGSPAPGDAVPAPAGLDPAVNQMLLTYSSWSPPIVESRDERDRDSLASEWTEGTYSYVCAARDTRTLSSEFTNFPVFAFGGEALPGLLVEGLNVLEGDLRALPFDRAPLTLQMDLASANPTTEVANPTSSGLTRAIAELKAGGTDQPPFRVDYVVEESSAYEEALLHMGISARYDSPGLRSAFASQFDQSDQRREHSVSMRLVQPMFTVSVDRSTIRQPGDYLLPSTDTGRIDALVEGGRIGADNPPVLIDTVTYGRAVYVTISSTEVSSARELKVAIEGAYGGFSGEGEVADQHRRIVANSQMAVRAYGGNQDEAFVAMRSGTIQDWLHSVNTANAIPLTFGLRTLDGERLSVTDQVTVTDIGCEQNEIPAVQTIWRLRAYTGPAWVDVHVNSTFVRRIERYSATTTVDLTSHMVEGRTNEVKVQVWPDTCLANPGVAIWIEGDGVEHQRRVQDAAACAWWSTWTVNDGTNTVTGPSNWHR